MASTATAVPGWSWEAGTPSEFPTQVTGIWTVICSFLGTLASPWIRSEVAKTCISTLTWDAGIPSGGTIYYATPIPHSVNSNIMYRFMLPSALGSEHSSSNLSPPVTNQPLPPDIWQSLTHSITTDLSFWECHKKSITVFNLLRLASVTQPMA